MSWTRKSKLSSAAKFLRAPWRWHFITKGAPSEGCLFCQAPQGADADSLICWRGKHFYVILNKYPYASGHLMIVPYAHLCSPKEMAALDATEIWQTLQLALAALDESLHPEGYNIGMNIGQAAGAGIKDHFHLHVVPRWTGDASFMPIVGNTRVASFDMEDIFRQLHAAFARQTNA